LYNANYNKICDIIAGHVLEYYPNVVSDTNIQKYRQGYLATIQLYEKYFGQINNQQIWKPIYYSINVQHDHQCVVIDAHSKMTISAIKQQVTQFVVPNQKILYEGNQLEDSLTLEHYGIFDTVILHLKTEPNSMNLPKQNICTKQQRLIWCGKLISDSTNR